MAATPRPGSIVHVEFHSADPGRTRRFYEQVFGWKFKDLPEMNYMLWEGPSPPAGGLMQAMEGRPPQVLNYLLSTNIDETLGKVSAAGGTVLQPRMEIQGQGWWALFQEPGGTVMALYQNLVRARPRPAAKKAKKIGRVKKAGRKRKR